MCTTAQNPATAGQELWGRGREPNHRMIFVICHYKKDGFFFEVFAHNSANMLVSTEIVRNN